MVTYRRICIGRYLCQAYYTGRLKPSVAYAENSGLWALARCVESSIQTAPYDLGEVWLRLLIGELRKLNTTKRAGLLGGGASNPYFGSLWDVRSSWVKGIGKFMGWKPEEETRRDSPRAKVCAGISAPLRAGSGDDERGAGGDQSVVGEGMLSLDGREGVRVSEVCLYYDVGWCFERVCTLR